MSIHLILVKLLIRGCLCLFLVHNTPKGAVREHDTFLYYLLIQYFLNIFCDVYVSFL